MKCKFIKADGKSCGANAVRGCDYCFNHDPESTLAKHDAVTKGGLARKHYQTYGDPIIIDTPKDIQDLLASVANGVWTGEIPANQPANTLGFIARCWLDAYEKCEIESRVSDLEKRIEDISKR